MERSRIFWRSDSDSLRSSLPEAVLYEQAQTLGSPGDAVVRIEDFRNE
jgi:hypothetical protein